MKLTIFGGTGGVGSRLVPMAIEAGHTVTAFARNPERLPKHEALTSVQGELSDFEAVSRAVAGADAVLSTLGARQNSPDQIAVFGTAMEHITLAMRHHGVKRLVAISGAGVLMPDDHVTFGRRFVRALLLRVSKHMALAKEREEEIIRASGLEWVLVRPPRIVPGPATGKYRVLPDRVPSPRISQGDVADLILRCATSSEWVRRAPIPGY